MITDMVSWSVSRHPEWDLMYSAGLTAREIADHCRGNIATVHRHLKNREKYQPGFKARHDKAAASRHSDKPSTQWRKRLACLVDFVEQNGRLPGHKDTPDEITLYRWLLNQRRSYVNGQMSPGKVFLLDEISGWKTDDRKAVRDQKWMDTLSELSVYLQTFGHLPRYRNYSSTHEQKLGIWLHNQHQRRSQKKLSTERLEALDLIFPGWSRQQ